MQDNKTCSMSAWPCVTVPASCSAVAIREPRLFQDVSVTHFTLTLLLIVNTHTYTNNTHKFASLRILNTAVSPCLLCPWSVSSLYLLCSSVLYFRSAWRV